MGKTKEDIEKEIRRMTATCPFCEKKIGFNKKVLKLDPELKLYIKSFNIAVQKRTSVYFCINS